MNNTLKFYCFIRICFSTKIIIEARRIKGSKLQVPVLKISAVKVELCG